MITMNELVDLRMQQHIAQEIYRQQIMQRIPDPFPPMLPLTMPRHVIMPPRVNLPGVEATLQNDDLWKQFHQIGTEMIITKSGRRMFPSMRLSLAGLEDESNYCVLLEMVPIGDCRFKFSGSQWVPAGGAEPQSPQRMFLHPDSPATGAHWQTQPILFNKVKLTNNTLDNNGHIVLASMHKYQPCLHVIRTSDLTQIPWAPQQAFVFPETEFVAVTAYQNDRITKLKIDNNPFAKGFRETGQSRSKRKMSSSPVHGQPEQRDQQQQQHMSPTNSATASARPSICSSDKQAERMLSDLDDGPQIKRMRSNGSACSASSFEEVAIGTDFGSGNSTSSGNSSPNRSSAATAAAASMRTTSPILDPIASNKHSKRNESHNMINNNTINNNNNNNNTINSINQQHVNIGSASSTSSFMHHFQQNMQSLLRPSLVDLACSYFGRPQPVYPPHHLYSNAACLESGVSIVGEPSVLLQLPMPGHLPIFPGGGVVGVPSDVSNASNSSPTLSPTRLSSWPCEISVDGSEHQLQSQQKQQQQQLLHKEASPIETQSPPRKKGFSISAILDGSS